MSDEEFQQAKRLTAALVEWIEDVDITDEGKLKEAIGILCSTARSLGVRRVADLERCSFDQILRKGSVLAMGLMDLCEVYDFDVREIIESAEIERVNTFGERATVRVAIDVLGERMTFDTNLERIDGLWYSVDDVAVAGN